MRYATGRHVEVVCGHHPSRTKVKDYGRAAPSGHSAGNSILQCRVGWLSGRGDRRRQTRKRRGTTTAGQIEAEHGSIVMAASNSQSATR